MGRMDIDYAVLEDAFLRYQTKPRLSMHGDLYYEVINQSRARFFRCVCLVLFCICASVKTPLYHACPRTD